ncbi:cyclopropane-fatty-acyl-phospholipid synthase family protein [Verrucomicrobium sp. BvORR034]|uniref:SAM-dependent methyltransferase n=1 Tax=Verrucomicrobium sp. BvORR034 TaxID=1396418 RepID=UPI00067851AE|nr:cyclopropane-fatty-acyl-phospholipid synthase family protein [Verrucomicrobium sp. BvORR034]
MNDTLTLESAGNPATMATFHPWTLYEGLVMRVLSRFSHGTLRLTWPDGTTRLLGDAGSEVTAEIRIRQREAFFQRCALYGNVGFGEGYVEGDWDTPDVGAVVTWFVENLHRDPVARGSSQRLPLLNLLKLVNRVQHWLRPNSVTVSRRNIAEHYDLGNTFYSLWLDATMTYSAARFTRAGQSLEEAQTEKYEALCRKLRLQSTDHVLEIGCGWGGFSSHAARVHGCRVTAVTISEEQHRYATERMAREGLSDRVEIRLQDYRHITGTYDKIASIEMLEAVGEAYLETYFAKCAELLKPEGLLAVQMITVPDCNHAQLRKGVDWIQKHIFPGSLLLSVGRVNEALNQTGTLFMHELEDLGAGYARTLALWHERFQSRIKEVLALGFDERFIRKWTYYLKYCEAAFDQRNISVVQACYTRPNNPTLREVW